MKELVFLTLTNMNYRWKNWVDWIGTRRDKMLQPQKCKLGEKRPYSLKAFKFYNFTFHDYLHDFSLKIETGWSARVVEPILKTRNIND